MKAVLHKEAAPSSYVEPKQSSEEKYIEDFFIRNNIDYEREVMLKNLNGDSKSYRRADFYLPNLRVYVEYFGQYNSSKQKREECKDKVKLYINNSIPTVFLYPYELGIIEYKFHHKLIKLLKIKKFRLNKELLRYKLVRYYNHPGKGHILVLAFGVLFLFTSDLSSNSLIDNLIILTIASFFGYNIYKGIRNYVIREQ